MKGRRVEMQEEIVRRISEQFGKVGKWVEIGGGDINRAARIKVKDRDYFVKWHPSAGSGQAPWAGSGQAPWAGSGQAPWAGSGQAPSAGSGQAPSAGSGQAPSAGSGQVMKIPGMFRAEAAGLEALGRVGAIKVPEVVLVDEDFLVLEWMEMSKSPITNNQSSKLLGEQMAKLHRFTGEKFGLPTDNFIGRLPQKNDEKESWVDFWWECRLLPQLEIAENRMKNEEEKMRNVRSKLLKLKKKLQDLLPKKPKASLLHGDLWGGNWSILDNGQPVIYDPAVYFGDREVDLAMSRLFGGFGEEFYKAYEAQWPLETSWEERVELYQLYPLMVHWNLFGNIYGVRVEASLQRCV